MDIYAYTPLIITSIAAAIALFLLFTYLRTKKMPPTNEPLVGHYQINLDVGSHIIPIKGALYYFNKLINPKHLHILAESIGIKTQIEELRDTLKNDNFHFYAIRHGMTKLAILSRHHAIETTPYFKTEEDTGNKIVIATGTMGKEVDGWKAVVMEPLDLKKHELNPNQYKDLENFGNLLLTIQEQAPVIEELKSKDEQLRIIREKNQSLADALGEKEDEAQYWLELYKRTSTKKEEEAGFGLKIPSWVKKYVPYGIVFAVGYLISPQIPQLTAQHPIVLAIALVVLGVIIRKVIKK